MTALLALLFVMAACAGAGVVLTRTPRQQVMALAVNGAVLSLLFMLLQAPDVAYSEIAVGTAVVPLMFLGTLVSLKTDVPTRKPRTNDPDSQGRKR